MSSMGGHGQDWSGSDRGYTAGSCENGTEPSGSAKFLNWLAEKCWFLFNPWGSTDISPWPVQLGVVFFREVFKTVLNRPAIFSPYTVYLQVFSNSVAAYFISQDVSSSSSEFHFMMTVARYILMGWQMTAVWWEIHFDTLVDQMY